MGRIITTLTDLSDYVGQEIKIVGSDCCWTVLGTSAPDSTIRKVTPVGSCISATTTTTTAGPTTTTAGPTTTAAPTTTTTAAPTTTTAGP